MSIKTFLIKHKYSLAIIFFSLMAIFFRQNPLPELFLMITLFYLWLSPRVFSPLKDFLPFLIVLIGYGLVGAISKDFLPGQIHIQEIINLERSLFGFIPTIELQRLFFRGSPSSHDYLLFAFYFTHFLVPLLAVAFILKKNKKLLKEFTYGFVILSFMAFLTYLLYPAAPPWLASQYGYLPPIHKIFNSFDFFNALYNKFEPNLVAAVPSVHAAGSLFTALFLHHFFRSRYSWLFFIIPLGIWLSVVYSGEHYVVDVLLGIIYALITFAITLKLSSAKRVET
jgi:hypothetical protein